MSRQWRWKKHRKDPHAVYRIVHPIHEDTCERLLVAAKQTGGSSTRHILQKEHGIALKQKGEATVLALERCVDLNGTAFVTENTGASAVDIAGIKQAVRMTQDSFLRLVTVSFGRRTTDRTAQRGRFVYAYMYMDCRLFLIKFCSYDIPRLFQSQ